VTIAQNHIHHKNRGLTPRAPDKCGPLAALSGKRPQPRQERGAGGRIRRLVVLPAKSRACR